MYDTWEELKKSIDGCKKCKLCNGRKNIVFGTRKRKSKIDVYWRRTRSR